VLTHDAVPGDRAAAVREQWTGIMYGLALALSTPRIQPQE
jgi:hypothetical protein